MSTTAAQKQTGNIPAFFKNTFILNCSFRWDFVLMQPILILSATVAASHVFYVLFGLFPRIAATFFMFVPLREVQVMGFFSFLIWVHELGHVLFFLRNKVPILHLMLPPIAGLTVPGKASTPKEEIDIALAGPLSGIIALPILMYGEVIGNKLFILMALGWLSINALNLLPLYPLDGGVVVKNLICAFVKPKTARRICWFITIAVLAFTGFLLDIKLSFILPAVMVGLLWIAEAGERVIYKWFSRKYSDELRKDNSISKDEALKGLVKYLSVSLILVSLTFMAWVIYNA